jgi:hypothetical protein
MRVLHTTTNIEFEACANAVVQATTPAIPTHKHHNGPTIWAAPYQVLQIVPSNDVLHLQYSILQISKPRRARIQQCELLHEVCQHTSTMVDQFYVLFHIEFLKLAGAKLSAGGLGTLTFT